MKYTRSTHSVGADALPPARPTRPSPGAAERPKARQALDPEPVRTGPARSAIAAEEHGGTAGGYGSKVVTLGARSCAPFMHCSMARH